MKDFQKMPLECRANRHSSTAVLLQAGVQHSQPSAPTISVADDDVTISDNCI